MLVFQIAESTESHIRGLLGSVPALFMALGILITYVVGAFIPWHHLSYFCAAFPVLLLFSMLLLPETPTWLITNDREERAKKALSWLRGGRNIE